MSDPDASAVIAEVRRLSGLSWKQLATLLGVSTRVLRFWASGRSLDRTSEEHLRGLLNVIREADRGTARANREMLLSDRSGVIPLDLLAEGRYEEFLLVVGEGPGRRTPKLTPLSIEAQEARRPLSPDELSGALQDRVHQDVGRARPVRAVRGGRRR